MHNRPLNVLLIEDDENDYLLTRNLLRKVESPLFELEWVRTYDGGIEAVADNRHDVVLLDQRLAERSGLELLRAAVASGCRTPIIVLTGVSNRESDLQAMEAGAADYLEKDQLNARLLERTIRFAIERTRAEEALKAERNLLRTLIDNMPDYIFAKDTQSRYIMANYSVLVAGGMTSFEQLIGKNDFDFFPHKVAQAFYEDECEVISSGQALLNKEEESVDLNTGQRLWFSTTKVPLRDSVGNIVGLIGIAHNITRRKQEEEKLSRLAAIVQSSEDAIISRTLDGIITTWNPGAERLYGYTADEIIGQSIDVLLPSDLTDELPYILSAIIRGEHIEHFETVRLRKDGSRIDVSLTISPVRDASGEIIGVSKIARDITQRKEMEEALRQSEARLRAIITGTPVILFALDRDGIYTMSEGKGLTALGRRSGERIGKSLYEVYADRPEVLESFRRALDGETLSYTMEANGGVFEIRLSPFRNQNGDVEMVIGVASDITEQKQAEEVIRESETRHRTLMEQASDAIFVADGQANYVDVNTAACQMLGYTRQELLKLNVKDVVSPEDLAAVPIPWEAMRTGTVIMERRLVRKDGTRVPVEVSAKILEDGRLQVFARDITERKQAEAKEIELGIERERIGMLQRFIADASHDLRTPLTIMNTSLYLLRKHSDPDKQKHQLDKLEAQIAHIQQLIEDMLTLSRLDLTAAEFQFELCDLNALVRLVCARQESLAVRKSHQMQINLAPDLSEIQANSMEMMIALEHLVVNALNYTPNGGTITVQTRTHEQQAIVEVCDTGIGISVEELPLIFERFYRADKARGMNTGNSGLGLTIAKKIIEGHRGTIEVESILNKGSTFRVLLPMS